MKSKLNCLYDKFFKAAMAAASSTNDAERLYKLLQTAATPEGQLHPEHTELYEDCRAVFAKTTRVSEVLSFAKMFRGVSDAPWVADKLLECAVKAENVLEYVTFLANEGKPIPEGYEERFHARFVGLCPSWKEFYDFVTFFDDGAYCPAIENYFFDSLSVGEFNIKKLWDLFPEWRTPRLRALYESTTIYGLTLD